MALVNVFIGFRGVILLCLMPYNFFYTLWLSTWKILFHQSSFYLRKVIFIFLRGEKSGKKVRGKSGRKFGRRCLRPICKCKNQAYPAVFRSLAGFHDLSIGLLCVGPMRTTVWRGCSPPNPIMQCLFPYFHSIYQFPVYPQSFKIFLIFLFN